MSQPRKYKIRRIANELVEEATKLGDPVKFQFHKEKKMTERWERELYGKVKAVTGIGIGGQMPGSGPDVLKYIKKYDPQNSSGAVKDSLDIMLKFQESVRSGDLLKNIQPIQSILGGGLYGKFSSAAASAAAAAKTKKKKRQEDPETQEEIIVEEDLGIISQLIDAAIAMLSPDVAILVADLLNDAEIAKIEAAYYSGGVYTSTVMPIEFVNAINSLIPTFRSAQGAA